MQVLEHPRPSGGTLRFENPEGLYPVNRYQSLLLAENAYWEALQFCVEHRRPLKSLCAVEICCGGGPAALLLKAAGVGHVEACDINARAVDACRHNAEVNGLRVDQIYLRDMLSPAREAAPSYDLIVCNPPCGRTEEYARDKYTDDMIAAVDGGSDGIDFVNRLIDDARGRLTPQGRLVFVLTSTMAVLPVVRKLNTVFNGHWHNTRFTPVAQPFVPIRSQRAEVLKSPAENGEILIWDGGDGYWWRLSWILSATHSNDSAVRASVPADRKLSLNPYAFSPRQQGFDEAVTRLRLSE